MVWRIGVVPYLNADPLAAALREPDAGLLVGDAVHYSATVPSRLIQNLLEHEVDVALVSTAAVLPQAELRILPDMCVASRGPVRSITLYTRCPVSEVRTVALDASSRSGHALTQVLLAEYWEKRPQFLTLPPDLPAMLEQADAALLIGNPALQANQALRTGRGPAVAGVYDLGEVWDQMTGLPFVYAVWAAPERGADLGRLTRLLRRAKSWGMRRRSNLASRGAVELGLPFDVALEYLTHSIRYDLGEAERAGMRRFCELAVRHGVLPAHSEARFYEASPAPAAAAR